MKSTSILPQSCQESNCCGSGMEWVDDNEEGVCSNCKEHCITQHRQQVEDEAFGFYEPWKENE